MPDCCVFNVCISGKRVPTRVEGVLLIGEGIGTNVIELSGNASTDLRDDIIVCAFCKKY